MDTDNNALPLQERDACLALALLLLIIWLFYRSPYIVYATMGVVLLGMVWPASMRPFAWLWFGMSRLLGKYVGAAMLGLIWSILVVPMGFARRAMGKDSMRLKQWHKGNDSVFVNRDHKYTPSDINAPY